jgi:hypothetical protein
MDTSNLELAKEYLLEANNDYFEDAIDLISKVLEKIKCPYCKHGEVSHTQMIGGSVIREHYCGLTKTDEFCYGRDFIED